MPRASDHSQIDLEAAPSRARPVASDSGSTGRLACFHCGEPCPDNDFARDGKAFCCAGCLVVHDLLTESGLGHFYDLSQAPGVRVRPATKGEEWTYLDEPALQQRLLDFTDGKISKVTFRIPTIHCVACVWLLENLFRLHAGIGGSQVNFPKREVAIRFSPEQIKLSELVALLASFGYEPVLTLGELEERKTDPARRRQWLQVGLAGFGFGNIMLISLPLYLELDSFSGPLFRVVFGYLSLALALPVLVYSASDYWKSAWRAWRQRVLTLDVPIALGLAALYAQSAFEILSGHGAGYLDSLTGLVFFLLCGRVFQQKTHERLVFDRDFKSFFPLSITRRVLPACRSRREEAEIRDPESKTRQSLLTSAPTTEASTPANIVGEERISLSQLQVGDRVLIRHGELIPADATLVTGPACIDYSFVTGESEPVPKDAGAHLYAGGKQIGGAIEVETVKPVSQGYLTSLWNHEAFQKDHEGGLDTLTNRYSRRFTRIVIVVAVGAAVFWLASGDSARAIKAFTSVLIVACPCALALAAPFTLGTAQRLLARLNVFLRNPLVVERLAQVDAIILDKTGTLTAAVANAVSFEPCGSPRPEAPAVKSEIRNPGSEPGRNRPASAPADVAGSGLTPAEAGWVHSLTRHSTHPLSLRIGESLASGHAARPVQSFRETPGGGIEGRVEGHEVRLGSVKWLASCGAGIDPTPRVPDRAEPTEPGAASAPGSVVGVAIDGRYRGAFILSSRLRPETDRLLSRLSRRYEVALLSGDHEGERERFRTLFGPEARLRFNQSPLDKLGFIRDLQQSGRTVMMVGDGLNDAGALQQSDVGVAVVEQVGAFSPASDVILEAGRVPQLFEVLTLARRAVSIVRLSFGISALYNLIGISIATAGLLSPVICAVLMPVSSVSVVLFACGATAWAARRVGFHPPLG